MAKKNIKANTWGSRYNSLPPVVVLNQSICIHLQLEGTCSIFDTRLNFTFTDPKQVYSARICLRSLDERQKHPMMVPEQIKIDSKVH